MWGYVVNQRPQSMSKAEVACLNGLDWETLHRRKLSNHPIERRDCVRVEVRGGAGLKNAATIQ
jgi:hypothetical protein